jgi:hypothetical protein
VNWSHTTQFTTTTLAVSFGVRTLIPQIANVGSLVNVYHITDYCPILYDPTGGITGTLSEPYFDRPDVKAAIHAPHKKWYECAYKNVFVGEGEPLGYHPRLE